MAAGGLKNVSFYLVLLVLLAVVLECMAALVLRLYPDIEHTRDYLRGKTQQQLSMNSVAQPYLLYIPAPGYVDPKTGIQQNNADGYRGDVVPLQREKNTFRVLFLGGSTTYGEGVERPEEAYPARLGELLQQDPAFVGKKVEVINAGLRFGTTAEIITHYLLKFRYYKPDAVIINPGGNDPVAYLFSSYQPDYSHWRKQAPYLKALPKHAAWLMESRTLSIPIVLLFFSDTAVGSSFGHLGEATPAHWFKSREEKKLHLDEVAFYNNMKTVIREIKNDGAAVFLLSYQGNPFDKKDQQMFRRLYDFEEQVLAVAAQETRVPFAPFPLSQMPESLWVDASHINAEGERIKARHAFEQFGEGLRQALGRQLEHRDDMVLEMITYD